MYTRLYTGMSGIKVNLYKVLSVYILTFGNITRSFDEEACWMMHKSSCCILIVCAVHILHNGDAGFSYVGWGATEVTVLFYAGQSNPEVLHLFRYTPRLRLSNSMSMPNACDVFYCLLFICWTGVEPSALIGLLYQSWMLDGDDCGAIDGMNDWQLSLKYSEETYSGAPLSIT
jgi:hypothetical protein